MSSEGKYFSVLWLVLLLALFGEPSILQADGTIAKPQVSKEANLPNGGRAPAYSPTGDKIAFLSSSLHTPSDLWVMNVDGSEPKRLTRRGVSNFRWDNEGKTIQFSTNRKGFAEIMKIGLDHAPAVRVPKLPPNSSVPIYSPDGSLFAFTVAGTKKSNDLWIGTADGKRVEAVTDNISVRSIFWGSSSRKIYYEAGKTYGIGLWTIDLSTMSSDALLNKYIGTPVFSAAVDLIAYPYPDQPGQFSVHTMQPDGTEGKVYQSPRLSGRSIAWDAAGSGVYYLGQDLVTKDLAPVVETPEAVEKPEALHSTDEPENKFVRTGVTSLWHLDFETGVETRISPEKLHLNVFSLAPDGKTAIISGVLQDSFSAELFRLDLSQKSITRLLQSRASSWMPVASLDSSKVAFFTNELGTDTLKVVSISGEQLEIFPGIVQEGSTRFSWLPSSDGLVFFSSRGVAAFNTDGPIDFPTKKDHRVFLYADVSIQSDKILLSSIPRFGQYPGLYTLEAVDDVFQQGDLRYPSAPEVAANFYLQPKWSFDEKWIAFSDREDIWVMKADGSGRKWITDFSKQNATGKSNTKLASHPVWSVSGEKLCYARTVYKEEGLLREIWVVQRDGSNPQMVYSEPIDSAFQWRQEESTNLPFFDVTDKYLIFTAMDDGLPNLYSADLAKLDSGESSGWFGGLIDKLELVTGGKKNTSIQRLTEQGGIFPVLLPEEDLIIYTSLAGNRESLWMMNSDGTEKRPFVVKPSAESAQAPAVQK